MKKLLSLLAVLVLSVTLVACSGAGTDNIESKPIEYPSVLEEEILEEEILEEEILEEDKK